MVSRVSLVDTHIKVLREIDVKLDDYAKDDISKSQFLGIQLDSIHKLNASDWEGCTLLLDDVNSLLKYVATSQTLKNHRWSIVTNLIQLIKNAGTILAVDADLATETIHFITECRKIDECVFYHNTVANYKGTEAISYLCEDTLMDALEKCIFVDKRKPVICFDSKTHLNDVYEHLKLIAKKYRKVKYVTSRSLKYTRNEGNRDDIKSWKNKIVFYSPRIIYGIDFHPPQAEDVFLISVKTTLNPSELVQQTNRNREIKKVHYHIAKEATRLEYNNIDEVKAHYEALMNGYDELVKKSNNKDFKLLHDCMSVTWTEDEEYQIVDNKFTKLYFSVKYADCVLKSNME